MPTGYTEILHRKELTLKQFALRCSRAFGSTIIMRDDPLDADIPEKFVVRSYNKEKISETISEIRRLRSFSQEEILNKNEEEYQKDLEYFIKRNDEIALLRSRYVGLIVATKNWIPPTEEHKELKKFILEQLDRGYTIDCYEEPLPKKRDWVSDKISSLKDDLRYYIKTLREERQRVKRSNKWLEDLRNSFGE